MTVPVLHREPPRRLYLAIRGAVQGVGFRPFVHRLAHDCDLRGWVQNNTSGVVIDIEGDDAAVAEFSRRLPAELPPRASIHGMESRYLSAAGYTGFEIRPSDHSGRVAAVVLPDIATCPDCLAEIRDPGNRRYCYPFTNCTNCGPRFTIIESLPYDRSATSMSKFPMCSTCHEEYDNPSDRRFHAQPNACPRCGPHLTYWNSNGAARCEAEDALQATVAEIRAGRIVAVKGLGGFHLVVDARNRDAVLELRHRKHREEKPFAIMYPDPEAVRRDGDLSLDEIGLLQSPEAPIVLVDRRERLSVCEEVSGPVTTLGVMLPYTPLHHLLMSELGFPVVATSGNLSDEPICTCEHDAVARLRGLADAFLIHNRPIVRHADDSIVRVMMGRPVVLRRARGYAPYPVVSAGQATSVPAVLAVGAHLKNALAVTTESGISISQHIGDLDTAEANAAFEKVSGDLTRLLDRKPEHIACDLHPDYRSTRWALRQGMPVTAVQHHHAHVVAAMLDNDLEGEVLGVAWDGTGYGADGSIWGGEFLHASRTDFCRVACLRTFPLPGGDTAVKEPRRSALGMLFEIYGEAVFADRHLAPVSAFSDTERGILQRMLTGKVNVARTSSAGRLFDAVASLLGLRQVARFEGQAAMLVEQAAATADTGVQYEFSMRGCRDDTDMRLVDWEPMITGILSDLKRGEATPLMAAKFHNTLVAAITVVARRHADMTGEQRVVLSGGCFQNKLLLEKSVTALRAAGLAPFWHQRIPPNDGGICAGQAAITLARLREQKG